MSLKKEVSNDLLEKIVGGSITYHPDLPGSQTGTIGIDGNYAYRYNSETAMLNHLAAHYYDKEWTSLAERDNYLLNSLISAGLVFPV